MRYLLLVIPVFLILSGCVKNNPDPVWLEINEWTLQSNPSATDDQGEMTHNFSEVWVYVDNKVIGVFELPCKIPVLVSGDAKVQLYPAIKNNGIASTKKIYPFVEPYVINSMNFVPGHTYTFFPTTKYAANCNFWIEDFDAGSVKIQTDNNFSNASLQIESLSSISLTGDYGHIALSPTDSLWVGVTTDALTLPKGKEIYLEIDYRNTNALLTGVRAFNVSGGSTDNDNISINAQKVADLKWRKIYIDLKEIVSYSQSAASFKQYFKSLLPPNVALADVYLDNIKIIHY
jgi:hypothetical protein